MHFKIGEFQKFCLVNGIDQIDWTLQFEDLILQHEKKVENDYEASTIVWEKDQFNNHSPKLNTADTKQYVNY